MKACVRLSLVRSLLLVGALVLSPWSAGVAGAGQEVDLPPNTTVASLGVTFNNFYGPDGYGYVQLTSGAFAGCPDAALYIPLTVEAGRAMFATLRGLPPAGMRVVRVRYELFGPFCVMQGLVVAP